MNQCQVQENCENFTKGRDKCWMCDDYKLYIAENKKILSPAQIKRKEEKKAEKKQLKNSDASKRGKAAKVKGSNGERELVKLLQQYNIPAERVPLSGALKCDKYSCDITCQINDSTKRVEVKRRKSGLTTLYKWLAQDKNSNYLMVRQDNEKWLVIMPIEEFILLTGDSK